MPLIAGKLHRGGGGASMRCIQTDMILSFMQCNTSHAKCMTSVEYDGGWVGRCCIKLLTKQDPNAGNSRVALSRYVISK